MPDSRRLLIVLFCVPFMASYGQKVKYKDIFALVETKQYEAAEPFLRKYLADEDDNPNAFLNMAVIYEDKMGRYDVLKETSGLVAVIDSSIYFYDRALQSLDEREIRKNREYYQAYNRRDLRTGEFGVKLSDIQFDIQKKKEALVERTDRIKMVNYYFDFADSLYRKSQELYGFLQASAGSLNEFYLQASDTTLFFLDQLALRSDSTAKFIERYQSSLETLGTSDYRPEVTWLEIKDLKTDGSSPADFYSNDLKLWDYKTFASGSTDVIRGSIFPMRKALVDLDVAIHALREEMKNDSVSVRDKLADVKTQLKNSEARKYDGNPLPLHVMETKVADLSYSSIKLEHESLRDTSDLHMRSEMIAREMDALNELDSVAQILGDSGVDAGALSYADYITQTYNNPLVLKNYLRGLKEYINREKDALEKSKAKNDEALNWLLAEDDTIPLFFEATESLFHPLLIEQDNFTLGLQRRDSVDLTGYFCFITPSRVAKRRVLFPVDRESFRTADPVTLKGLSTQSGDQVYYLLIFGSQGEDEKFPATLAKIYRSDGLSWSINKRLGFVPEGLAYDQATGELTVRSEDMAVVFDKNGQERP